MKSCWLGMGEASGEGDEEGGESGGRKPPLQPEPYLFSFVAF